MRLCFIITLAIAFFSCSSKKPDEKAEPIKKSAAEYLIEDTAFMNYMTSDIPIKESNEALPTKFVFFVFEIDEPKIVDRSDHFHLDPVITESSSGVMPPRIDPGVDKYSFKKEVVHQTYIYKSGIIEIAGYSEDKKYQELDKYEYDIILPSIRKTNQRIELQNMMGLGDAVQAEGKILNRNTFVFDSYSAASIAKERQNK